MDNLLLVRDLKFHIAKFHLTRAQQRMQTLTNAHRTDRHFEVGDSIFIKLQSYRKITLSNLPFHKLTSKYFVLYPIVESIGSMAYKLLLPPIVKIHPIFHISQLKFCHVIPTDILSLTLPAPFSQPPSLFWQEE